MNLTKLISSAICFIGITLTESLAHADCHADPTTTHPIIIPAFVQTALDALPTKLGGPLKLLGQTISVKVTRNEKAQIFETNCVDENNCPCGVADDGTLSGSYGLSYSLTFTPGSIGPITTTVAGYDLEVSLTESITGTGSATITRSGNIYRTCEDDTWHYNVYATGTFNGSETGTATATVKVSDPNDPTTPPSTYTASATVAGTVSYLYALQLSDTAAATGGAAFAGGSQTFSLSLPGGIGAFSITQASIGAGF